MTTRAWRVLVSTVVLVLLAGAWALGDLSLVLVAAATAALALVDWLLAEQDPHALVDHRSMPPHYEVTVFRRGDRIHRRRPVVVFEDHECSPARTRIGRWLERHVGYLVKVEHRP